MELPHLVVIDDSEAMLNFARAILSAHYAVSTAKDGREGLSLCRRLRPQAVLLDLSMPEMDGEQVLMQLQSDSELEHIPVIIVSSEQARAEACLAKGATSHLVKPVRADELVSIVGRALELARSRAARGSLAILPLGVGALELAVPLMDVRHVIMQPALHPLPGGPAYLVGFIEVVGEPICVIDLAARFGVDHDQPILERKLVVVEREGHKLALCADRVRDPEEILPGDVRMIVPEGATDEQELEMAGALHSVVKSSRGPLPVVRPLTLLSRGVLRSLPDLVKGTR